MHARRMPTIQPMCQAVHAKPAMTALEDESGQNEPMQNWRERISVDPAVCHGRACVRGIRVLVSVKVDNVAGGVSREEMLNYL
jgi:hypothetical protein